MGGTESKETSVNELGRLLNNSETVQNEEYWQTLFRTPLSTEDVKAMLSFDDIRNARQNMNPNLAQFFKQIVKELDNVIDLGSYGILTPEARATALTCVRLVTRIMPMLLEVPAAHSPNMTQNGEAPAESLNDSSRAKADFVHSLFWWDGKFQLSQFTTLVAVNTHKPSEALSSGVDESDNAIVGVQLLTSLQRLLFLNGFTVITTARLTREEALPKHKVDTRFLWKGGIGSVRSSSPGNPAIYSARTEVLKCLITFLSPALFFSIEEYQRSSPPLGLWVATRGYLPYTANLYCSLMSTVFNYQPTSGYVSARKGENHATVCKGGFFSSSAEETALVSTSLQFLCLLIDFNYSVFQQGTTPPKSSPQQHHYKSQSSGVNASPGLSSHMSTETHHTPPAADSRTRSSSISNGLAGGAPSSVTFTVRNAYRLMLSGMRRPAEAELVLNGTLRLLRATVKSKTSYMSGYSGAGIHQELLILLWHLLTSCQFFLRRVCLRCDSTQLLTPLLFLLVEASTARRVADHSLVSKSALGAGVEPDDQQQPILAVRRVDSSATPLGHEDLGLLHLCSFILLVLSSEREFAVKLNTEYTERFPAPIAAFSGSYADLLVLVSYRAILDSLGFIANDSLIDMLLTVLCNVSAYIKSFCLESCVKLMSLVSRFSKPSWLFRGPYHYHNLFFLLDLLNNAIQYQYEGNLRLVYAILRQKDLFLYFQSLTLPSKYSSEGGPTVAITDTIRAADSTPKNEGGALSNDMPLATTESVNDEDSSSLSTTYKGSAETMWTPTETWFTDWKSKAPMQTILRLINCLLPMVEAECLDKGLINQDEVLDFLKRTTMVGLLPVPHAIIIRNYHPNTYTALWFTTYTWGVIIAKNQEFFDLSKIRLVTIHNT